jgi:hypothetical protein
MPLTRQVIARDQNELDAKPEKSGGDKHPDEFRGITHFHEKQNDQHHLSEDERADERRVKKFQIVGDAENREVHDDQQNPGQREKFFGWMV